MPGNNAHHYRPGKSTVAFVDRVRNAVTQFTIASLNWSAEACH